MALGIFAGMGLDVKATGNWEFVSVSSIPVTMDMFIDLNELVEYCDGALTQNDYQEIDGMVNQDSSVYILGKDEFGNLYYRRLYRGRRSTVCINNSGDYTDLRRFHSSWYILKKKVASPSSASDSDAVSPTTHTHSYSWVTVQEANAGQDGIEEYRCSCGDVQGRSVIPASEVAVKGLFGEIKNAPQNGTATFDSGRLYTISDYVIKKLAERTDVTTVITFEYQNQAYKMTIPAGADFTGLLADEDYFYGYFFFANAVGATIEAI